MRSATRRCFGSLGDDIMRVKGTAIAVQAIATSAAIPIWRRNARLTMALVACSSAAEVIEGESLMGLAPGPPPEAWAALGETAPSGMCSVGCLAGAGAGRS